MYSISDMTSMISGELLILRGHHNFLTVLYLPSSAVLSLCNYKKNILRNWSSPLTSVQNKVELCIWSSMGGSNEYQTRITFV